MNLSKSRTSFPSPTSPLIFLVLAIVLIPPCARAETKPVQMERFVVHEKPMLCFGIAVTLWEDKNTRRVLEMYVKAVQPDSMAEDKGLRPGTRIWSIDGQPVDNFDATFAPESDLGRKFLNRRSGEVIVLEVKVQGEHNSRFVSLTQNQLTITIRDGPLKLSAKERKQVESGLIKAGFTAGMVTQAMGNPAKVVKMDPPEAQSELWIYKNYTPTGGKGHFWYDPFSYGSSKLPTAAGANFSTPGAVGAPSDSEPPASPPGGVPTYKLMVLFTHGQVSEVGLHSD